MRILIIIFVFLLPISSAYSKDVITKTDGTKIDVKVEEITEGVIKYRNVSNPTGPIYTISRSSVATVLYENGELDEINTNINSPAESTNQFNSTSDEELIRLYEVQKEDNKDIESLSDAQLINMANVKTPSEKLYNKAKKYQKIGWIGGGTIFTLCTVIGILSNHQNQFDAHGGNKFAFLEGLGFGIALGGAWCLGFYLKANSLIKQAREMQLYSSTIIENEFIRFGDNSLTAGINVMGNRMVNSHSLGLSIGLNF